MIDQLKTHVDALTDLLQRAKVSEAINKMNEVTKGTTGDERQAVIIYAKRWNELQEKDAMDLSTAESIDVETNKLIKDILLFFSVEELEDHVVPPIPRPIKNITKMSREIREVMIRLFENIADAEMLAEDIEIDLGRINRTGTVEMVWREIVKEAKKQDILNDLIGRALEEYPNDPKLLELQGGEAPDPAPDPAPGRRTVRRPDPVPPPVSPKKVKIYFSYAWGDSREEGESREKLVNDLYEALEQDGIDVIRDKMDLEYGGRISSFMRDIGEGDLIIVFISDKYLRSQYCMHELMEIFRNTRGDREEFAKAVLPVSVERVKLSDASVLDGYFGYWEAQNKEWEDLIDRRRSQVTESQTDQWQRIKRINQNFGDLADFIRDINSSSKALLSENDFALVKDAIRNRVGG